METGTGVLSASLESGSDTGEPASVSETAAGPSAMEPLGPDGRWLLEDDCLDDCRLPADE